MKIWLVLPVYNEGQAVISLCQELIKQLDGQNYRIVIVDDGSTDGIIETLQASIQEPRLTILSHPHNQGLGRAMASGLNYAQQQTVSSPQDAIVAMDADHTHPPTLIPKMLEQLKTPNTVVIASRYQPGSWVAGLSLYRQILSHGASWLFRLFHPIPGVKDYTCGFRAYRASILHQAFNVYQDGFITEKDFTCMAEILIKLSRLGATFQEIPFTLRYDFKVSTSKMKVLKTVFRSLLLLRNQTK